MGITEILRRIWLFSANKIKSSESFSKQPNQLIIVAHNCHTSSTSIDGSIMMFEENVHQRGLTLADSYDILTKK